MFQHNIYKEAWIMPVFKSGKGLAPKWCEMNFFDIVELPAGAKHTFKRIGQKEKLIVGNGQCRLVFDDQTIDANQGANLDLVTPVGQFEVLEALSKTTLIRMCGHWGDEIGGSGIFTANKATDLNYGGDSVDYPKETNFDNHYHDCDEYWIIFEGRGVSASEGKLYEIGPGDCVVTGMGHHHDLPIVFEPIKAVFFETTLEGKKRHGHLWNHTHGQAEPEIERL
jgi:mannose-6-phosphate isomerase-like protein (cupin superfamily)